MIKGKKINFKQFKEQVLIKKNYLVIIDDWHDCQMKMKLRSLKTSHVKLMRILICTWAVYA